jgi:hypothetical protein
MPHARLVLSFPVGEILIVLAVVLLFVFLAGVAFRARRCW